MRQEKRQKTARIPGYVPAAVLTAAFIAAAGPACADAFRAPAWNGVITAQAAERTAVTEYDEETLKKLADNVLEYGEIPGLIEQYNVTFRNQLEMFYKSPDGEMGLTRTQLLDLAAELRAEADDLESEAEDIKKDVDRSVYEKYKANVRSLKHYATQLERAADGESAAGSEAIRELRILREEQTRSADALMRDHQTFSEQDAIAKKNLEIAELAYESAKKQQELGLYSAEDVLNAEKELNSARAAATQAAAELAVKKQELLLMLGWRYDADPQIMKVPAPETEKIAGFDPQKDAELAIQNNHTLYTTHNTSYKQQGGVVAKERKVQDQEKLVRQNLELLYEDVLQKQAAMQAAQTAFTTAENKKAEADRRNAVGLLSRREYLAAEAAYMTAVQSHDSAELALTAAIEEYEWALKGLMDIGQ